MISPETFDVLYPAKMFMRVLFPAPDGPIIAVNSPGLRLPETPCKMVLLGPRREKNLPGLKERRNERLVRFHQV